MVMHWHLVHTKPKQEILAQQNLEQQGYNCYLPLIHGEKLRQGKVAVKPTPLFPRYLFIQLGNTIADKSWTPIRSTKGVNRLVFFGTAPAKVDEQLISSLREEELRSQANPEMLHLHGSRVLLTQGAFAGLEGIYQMSDGEQRAMVLIELMSRTISIRVPPAALRKIN